MKIWDLLTKPPAELAQDKFNEFYNGIWDRFWQGFDDFALIGFMICLFLWMFSVPKMGNLAWVLVAVYVTVKVFRVIL